VAGAPPGAWPGVLQDHLDGLRALLRQLSDAARANEDTLRQLGRPAASAVSAGPRPGDPASLPAANAGVLDQLTMAGNIERALAVTGRTGQPLLDQYVGGNGD
ncbi:MAG: hypothetical protein ABWX69_01800, partial [Arthrobacter sp.]